MRPRRNHRGFTLVELSTALALFGLLTTATWALTQRAIDQGQRTAGYDDDLRGAQKLLGQVSHDLRASSECNAMPDGFRIEGRKGPVVYRLRDGVVTRTLASGPSEPVARRIRTLAVRRDGDLYAVTAQLVARGAESGSPAGRWCATVRPRVAGAAATGKEAR